jgi:hypothetical protein
MKIFLLIAFVLIGNYANAQKDTSNVFRMDSAYGFLEIRFGAPGTEVSIVNNKYYVTGDTMDVIRMLVRMVEKWQDLHFEKFVAVSAAMNFIDTVPAQYKKGKQWEAWRKQLKAILEQ